MSLRLAALTALITLAAFALGGPTVSAQTPTEETLLTNVPEDGNLPSAGNCAGQAVGFTTGSNVATITKVRIYTNSASTTLDVRADDSGEPSTTVLYSLTRASASGDVATYNAPGSATLSANTRYWLVAPVSNAGTCKSTGAAIRAAHSWTDFKRLWWNNNRWNDNTGGMAFAIVGTVEGLPAHDPEIPSESDDYEPLEPQPVTPKPFCNSSGRDPSGGTECYWRSYDQIPISDPCDQPWQVRGSYRHDRGCLNRY